LGAKHKNDAQSVADSESWLVEMGYYRDGMFDILSIPRSRSMEPVMYVTYTV